MAEIAVAGPADLPGPAGPAHLGTWKGLFGTRLVTVNFESTRTTNTVVGWFIYGGPGGPVDDERVRMMFDSVSYNAPEGFVTFSANHMDLSGQGWVVSNPHSSVFSGTVIINGVKSIATLYK